MKCSLCSYPDQVRWGGKGNINLEEKQEKRVPREGSGSIKGTKTLKSGNRTTLGRASHLLLLGSIERSGFFGAKSSYLQLSVAGTQTRVQPEAGFWRRSTWRQRKSIGRTLNVRRSEVFSLSSPSYVLLFSLTIRFNKVSKHAFIPTVLDQVSLQRFEQRMVQKEKAISRWSWCWMLDAEKQASAPLSRIQ